MQIDFGRLQLKMDKAEIIHQLAEYPEPVARDVMKTMLSDAMDASRPAGIPAIERQRMDRRMYALMELFEDRGMSQEVVRLRQGAEPGPVASPAPARSRAEHRRKDGPRDSSEEPTEVRTPGVIAAEQAASGGGGLSEAFLRQQMDLMNVMQNTLTDTLRKTTTAPQRASTIKIAPTVEWPTLHEHDTDVKEFFQLFKDTAKLANDGKGMEWREMLQILPNRLQGSRLKYAKLILKQARETQEVADASGPERIFGRIEAKLMRFAETSMQKRSRILKMYGECYKGKQSALQFEPIWENLLMELESIGMTRTADEAYIVYLQRTGDPLATRIRTDRRMRPDLTPGVPPGTSVMREPATWEEAHELAIEFEQQDQNRSAVAATFAINDFVMPFDSGRGRRKKRGGRGGGGGDQIQGGDQPRMDLYPREDGRRRNNQDRGPSSTKTKPCFDFRDSGSCKNGNQCKWSHDPEVIKAARRQKNETNAYLNRMEKEWQASLGQWPGKGGKSGKSGKSGKGKSSKGGKSKGKSSKGDSKSGKGKGDRDRNKGKGMFGTLNLADISKMSKEQAQAVLAKYAEAVQGQYAVVPKKKKGDQNLSLIHI